MQLARKIGATCSAYVTFSPAANAGCAISSTPPSTAASADIGGWRFISDVSLTDKPGPTPTLGGPLERRPCAGSQRATIHDNSQQIFVLPNHRGGVPPSVAGGVERPLTSPRASSMPTTWLEARSANVWVRPDGHSTSILDTRVSPPRP